MPINSEPNQPITLVETDIVDIDGQTVNVPVKVVFQLFPYPSVIIALEQWPSGVPTNGPFKISMRNGAQLDAMCLSSPFLLGGVVKTMMSSKQ